MLNQDIQEINKLNKEFYELHAESFDKSRKSNFWKGFDNTLNIVKDSSKILDIGCGNARYLQFLLENNIKANYFGIDNIDEFIKNNQVNFSNFKFELKDIVSNLNSIEERFDVVTIFGVTHHIPNEKFRNNWIKEASKLVQKDGYLVMSFWNFDTNKADKEYKPSLYQLESGDYFLGWKGDFSKHRYCHLFSETEIEKIINLLEDFKLTLDYSKDDNRYLILKKER